MKPGLLITLLLMSPALGSAQDVLTAKTYLGKESPISLRDAVFLALQNNLDLQVARTDPAIAAETVEQARGAFDPSLFASHDFNHNEIPVANAIQDAISGAIFTEINEDEWNSDAGFSGLLPFGLSYTSRYHVRRLDSNSSFTNLDPEWRSDWLSEIRLPLMKDLIYNEANLTVKRSIIAENISNEEFRARLRDEVVGVERAYWDLAAARAELRVEEKSRQTARDLLGQTRVQYEVGVVSKVSVTQAEAGVADRDFRVIVSANRSANLQDGLLHLVLAPGAAGFADTELIPDDPAYSEYDVELDRAIASALNRRPELVAAKKRVEDAQIQLAFAGNQRMPQLDLTASYAFNGLSGSAKPGATVTVDDGFSSSNSSFFRAEGERSWSLGGEMSIPFRNTSAKALVAQRRIELRRARTVLRRTEQDVILGVRTAVRALGSAIDGVEAAERNRLAREETLRAEQEKLRLGDSTPHDVLEFEEDLVDAERQKIFALRTYQNAITEVEKNQETLLESRGISVEKERLRGNDR